MSYDLVIRGGSIADGSGAPLFDGDVAVADGKIAAVGAVSGKGTEEIDAKGLLVTPGFVDIHTHYDGQATWEERLVPSSWHGVTTTAFGNCGVGFAPVRASDHQNLIELMEGVEEIPGSALHAGLKWDWESFPDYLDALDRRRHDMDLCAQVPHAALRVFVMGERALRLEDATPDDIAAMRDLSRDAMQAGAFGFTTSRSLNHMSANGDPTPTLKAREDELTGIAMGLKDAGSGVMQMIGEFTPDDRADEIAILRSGRWHQIALSVDTIAAVHNYYLDGRLVLEQSKVRTNKRDGLRSDFLLFVDDTGRDSPIDIRRIAIFPRVLSSPEIQYLRHTDWACLKRRSGSDQ